MRCTCLIKKKRVIRVTSLRSKWRATSGTTGSTNTNGAGCYGVACLAVLSRREVLLLREKGREVRRSSRQSWKPPGLETLQPPTRRPPPWICEVAGPEWRQLHRTFAGCVLSKSSKPLGGSRSQSLGEARPKLRSVPWATSRARLVGPEEPALGGRPRVARRTRPA